MIGIRPFCVAHFNFTVRRHDAIVTKNLRYIFTLKDLTLNKITLLVIAVVDYYNLWILAHVTALPTLSRTN